MIEIGSVEDRDSEPFIRGQKRHNESAKTNTGNHPEQLRINSNAREERKLMKPGGTAKILTKKPVKLPMVSGAQKSEDA